jgi:hypothetical protein
MARGGGYMLHQFQPQTLWLWTGYRAGCIVASKRAGPLGMLDGFDHTILYNREISIVAFAWMCQSNKGECAPHLPVCAYMRATIN